MNTQDARKLIEEALSPSFRPSNSLEVELASALSEALEDVERMEWLGLHADAVRENSAGWHVDVVSRGRITVNGSLREAIDAARGKP